MGFVIKEDPEYVKQIKKCPQSLEMNVGYALGAYKNPDVGNEVAEDEISKRAAWWLVQLFPAYVEYKCEKMPEWCVRSILTDPLAPATRFWEYVREVSGLEDVYLYETIRDGISSIHYGDSIDPKVIDFVLEYMEQTRFDILVLGVSVHTAE